MTYRESHLVELVHNDGSTAGTATVAASHRPPGQLHRAFSVLLVDPAGRVLLQRRAAVKTRFPLRWANSCCGHPAPGETVAEAANKRLREELGIAPVALTEVGVHLYRAEDPVTGRVEFEYDHVLRAEVPADITFTPDDAEVAEVRWVDPVRLESELHVDPDTYAPWLAGVVECLLRPARPGPDGAGPTSGVPSDDAAERPGGR